MDSNAYRLEDLLYLMSRLRDPDNGCPWDLEQTPKTIIPHSIEEVYELAEVVEQDAIDYAAMKDELGDVLLQVVFFAQFASELEKFQFPDIVNHLCEKMIRRHPHVFPDGELRATTTEASSEGVNALSSDDVKKNWEAIKQQERDGAALKDRGSKDPVSKDLFENIPQALPALSFALKHQKKAKKIGLDWGDAEGAIEKLREEIGEIESLLTSSAQVESQSTDKLDEELGDLLFSAVNVARKFNRDPEQLLRAATNKFAKRARYVDQAMQIAGGGSHATSSKPLLGEAEIDQLWRDAKSKELYKTET